MNCTRVLLFAGALAAPVRVAHADGVNGCTFMDLSKPNAPVDLAGARGAVIVERGGARLVARLVDAPRTKATLSIDEANGNHFEVIWDPVANGSLQHSVVIPEGRWRLSPSVDDDRMQSGQVVVLLSTEFPPGTPVNESALKFSGTTKALIANSTMTTVPEPTTVSTGRPQITLSCEVAQVDMAALQLDSRRAVAALNARSIADQAVPAPVEAALSLLAEIAIERAKAGAMELVKAKFVDPMCSNLTLQLFTLGDPKRADMAFPHSCAILNQLRLDDVLSSGKTLVESIKDDVRHAVIPALLDRMNLNDETRELARLALEFGNRILDGETSTVTAVDMLIAEVERVPWSGGFEGSVDIVLHWLDSTIGGKAEEFEMSFLKQMLPVDLDHIPNPPWRNVSGCWRDYGTNVSKILSGGFPVGHYNVSDRTACIANLSKLLATPDTPSSSGEVAGLGVWTRHGLEAHMFSVADVANYAHGRTNVQLGKWLLDQYRGNKDTDRTEELRKLLPTSATTALATACTARLLVGVAKWCGNRDSCSAGDIADAIDHPNKYFSPSQRLPDSLCWTLDKTFAYPTDKRALDLGAQLVSFLQPPPKGEEQRRAVAMVRWLFHVVNMLNATADKSMAGADNMVDHLESIVTLLIDREYLRAMTESIALATDLCSRSQGSCVAAKPAAKAMQLIGAVVSYVNTYEETKTLPSADARAARKKALESLIDSATDRRDRAGNQVSSFGIPVGFAAGWRWTPGGASSYKDRPSSFDRDFGFEWRVPLAIATQRIPGHHPTGCAILVPTHLALWVADLGQFAHTHVDGASNATTWKDFLGVGLQVGYLVGSANHSAVVALEGSWAPGLYGRDVPIRDATGMGTHLEHVEGAFTFGLTLAYYVPLFDFN